MASQLRIYDGTASLHVETHSQAYIMDICRTERNWLWEVQRDDLASVTTVTAGGWRVCRAVVLKEGRAKTWAEAYRAGLRACEKLALKEAAERKRKKAKAKSKK